MMTEVRPNTTMSLPFWEGSDLLMHPYWKQYRQDIEAIPAAAHYAMGLFVGVAGIVGIAGNLLVIYVFST